MKNIHHPRKERFTLKSVQKIPDNKKLCNTETRQKIHTVMQFTGFHITL